ncbi:carboxypeptidase-like regulatory domain-containing protein [Lysobacter sp. KIS68-7]|uniref:carboxypeptidase-like regulatory domain-containing protein n=1 Tax=Lysobacter sp. KIS68-7 TaxID=2904252 RepID=UPI001E59D2DC|nr:carboxypeptidase-like regulatory domain-containing protein [Lysobacter sp. KIS68-7]UHQ20469.1 carboxypeptidase-like regulatory domain-containing protein [Lysobacter sp. KIS68-7]
MACIRILVLGVLAGAALLPAACSKDAQAPATTAPVDASTAREEADASMRAWLASMLTCGDRAFLRSDIDLQQRHLSKIPGMKCSVAPGPPTNAAPLQCAIAPPLHLAQADIGWFVIGRPENEISTIILPAPPESLRTSLSTGVGMLSEGTDLGDTTVQCALTDEALAPGAITGTVQRQGDPSASVRVCAFELADGVPTCTTTPDGQRHFRIDKLPRGDYLVLAVPEDAPDSRVGFTDCTRVPDAAACTHELQIVVVRAGRATEGVDPADVQPMEDAGDWPQPPPVD